MLKNTGMLFKLVILALLGSLALSACGAGTPNLTPTPTVDIGAIQTFAVSTFASGLTQTAIAMPTNTPTYTPTGTTQLTPARTAIPTVSCYGLVGVKDVTVPDNTPMVPGQTFVKTWLVKNTGTCTWDAGFKLVFYGGDAMGGVTLVLTNAVSPGAETELSVSMTAPSKTGTVRGNWLMSTTNGTFFGDELFVIINVGGATSTATVTPTMTVTQTPTTSSGN